MIEFQAVIYKNDHKEKFSQCIKHLISINSAQDGNDQCNSIFKYSKFALCHDKKYLKSLDYCKYIVNGLLQLSIVLSYNE